MTTKLQRNEQGAIALENFRGKLRLRLPRFLFGGVQKWISLGLNDNAESRKKARAYINRIEIDIAEDTFDFTLESYKPKKKTYTAHLQVLPSKPTQIGTPIEPDLDTLWVAYTNFKKPQLQISTILYDYNRVAKQIAQIPPKIRYTTEAREVMLWLLTKFTPGTTRRILVSLNACCQWAMNHKMIERNHFDGLSKEIHVKRTGKNSREPFTTEERDAIVGALKTNKYVSPFAIKGLLHSVYYAPYVEFLFLTGCRLEEATALKWKHVGVNRITFTEAFPCSVRLTKATKTGQDRLFPINESLRSLLESQRKEGATGEDLVFPAPGGKEINSINFGRRTWKPVIMALIKEGLVERYLPPYNCRHSFVTHCVEAGVSIPQIAKWVGNSAEVILKHYAGVTKYAVVPEF